jgi:hypothetical protein
MQQQRMTSGKVRRAAVEVRAIVEVAGLRNRIAVPRNKPAIRIGLPGHRIGHGWRDANKAVRRTINGQGPGARARLYVADEARIESIVDGNGPGEGGLDGEPFAHAIADPDTDAVVPAFVPRAIAQNRLAPVPG